MKNLFPAAVILAVSFFVAGLVSLLYEAGRALASPPAPRPAAAPAQAIYEAQIRELTLEIRARETELDQLVEALDATARERDTAMRVVRQLQRGQAL